MNVVCEIWIASYVFNIKGWEYLKWTLENCCSIKKASIHLVIHCPGFNINELILINDNITIYEQSERFNQLDGYEIIYHKRKLCCNPDDIVLFLDDDDLILPNAFNEMLSDINIDGRIGLQLLPINNNDEVLPGASNVTLGTLFDFIKNNKGLVQFVQDFSGTVTRHKFLGGFFDVKNEFGKLMRCINLGDITFMNYIEALPHSGISRTPTIYHRIKEYQSQWITDLFGNRD